MSDPVPTDAAEPFWKRWLRLANSPAPAARTTGTCDVCNRECGPDAAGLISTAEAVRSTAYWTERVWPRFAVLPESASATSPRALAFLGLVRRLVGNSAPWLVCDACLGLFDVDRDLAHQHAGRWFARDNFAPPGSGAVPMARANIGELAFFAPNEPALAAACVLTGLRGTVARGSGRRTHFNRLSDSRVLGKGDRIDSVWPILLCEGVCLVEVDLSQFHAATLVLWVTASTVLGDESHAAPRLTLAASGSGIGESGACFLLERVLRVEVACRGCKRSPAKALDLGKAVTAGRCEWCGSGKAYLLVGRP